MRLERVCVLSRRESYPPPPASRAESPVPDRKSSRSLTSRLKSTEIPSICPRLVGKTRVQINERRTGLLGESAEGAGALGGARQFDR